MRRRIPICKNTRRRTRPITPGLFEPRITSAPRTWSCVATLPNRDNPPGQESRFSHGNGHLWVELWPQGNVRATRDDIRPDGSITVKVPWTRGVSGRPTITGKRLDAQAPPARARVPDYGRRGFQSSLVVFPTPGCWQVTGRVGGVSLTFVIKVVAPADQPGQPLPSSRSADGTTDRSRNNRDGLDVETVVRQRPRLVSAEDGDARSVKIIRTATGAVKPSKMAADSAQPICT